jgi:hypothetical protein
VNRRKPLKHLNRGKQIIKERGEEKLREKPQIRIFNPKIKRNFIW